MTVEALISPDIRSLAVDVAKTIQALGGIEKICTESVPDTLEEDIIGVIDRNAYVHVREIFQKIFGDEYDYNKHAYETIQFEDAIKRLREAGKIQADPLCFGTSERFRLTVKKGDSDE